jgi:hypothetical protein
MPKHSSRLAGNFAGLGEKTISIAMGNCHARQNQALRGVHLKSALHMRIGAKRLQIHCSLLE